MGRNPRSPGYAALRRGRVSLPDHFYLVTTATHDRKPLFRTLGTGRIVVRELQRLSPVATTYCYVVMPDHLHWLLQLNGDTTLKDAVRGLKGRSARTITRTTSHTAPIWQPGFHDHGVRRDADLRAMARYVIANPLRAGLVERVGDYPLWDAVWVEG
ncbi:transposase [Aquisalimonas sp.]|uniref:REP-associated tyrosine transposase n=1 Tax=Aquisalimonas sp. TaxID=1872621 RepID=UPI0025B90175|nr:transposase [Aquisalimonas sp.]